MNISEIIMFWPKAKHQIRKHPIISLLFFLIIVTSSIFISSYLQEKGKQFASFKNKQLPSKKNIAVTSYNQSGGITAYKVNIGSQHRKLNQQMAGSLKSYLPTDRTKIIIITSIIGDPEAFQFATEIKEYLESEGYKVNGINQALYSKPVLGQIIKPTPEGSIEIIIGNRVNK